MSVLLYTHSIQEEFGICVTRKWKTTKKLQVVKYVHKNRIGIITEKQLYKGHKLGFAKYIKLRVINIFWEIYEEKGWFICWEYCTLFALRLTYLVVIFCNKKKEEATNHL